MFRHVPSQDDERFLDSRVMLNRVKHLGATERELRGARDSSLALRMTRIADPRTRRRGEELIRPGASTCKKVPMPAAPTRG
jgi:hypothetical protein